MKETGVKTQQDDDLFTEVLKELDTQESRIIVRMELRKFQKPTTLIQGLKGSKADLEKLTHDLKRKLATGGTLKDGLILLQGDHRERIKEILVGMGYSPEHIEVQ